MKIPKLLLLTLIILASILPVIHTECVFLQCSSGACGQFDTSKVNEQTSPGLVYTAEVDSGLITSECLTGCGLFDINDAVVNFVGETPDMDTDPSGKPERDLGGIKFSCTPSGGDPETTLTLIVSAININDNEAVFVGKTEYKATIPELAKPGVVLDFGGDIILNDMDRLRDLLTYNLITEDAVPFEVNALDDSFSADGKIQFQVKVTNPPAVDFERVRKYNLTLAVTDAQEGTFKDKVSSVTLIISVEDLDDKDPVFNHTDYAATIEEGTTGNLTVMPENIDAYDQDMDLNVGIAFSITNIVGDCPADSLEINAVTGIMRVNDTRLKAGECIIELTARQVDDDQRSARATLTLTISDIDTSCPGFEVTQLTGRVDPEDAYVYRADGVDKLLLQVTDNDSTFSGNLTLHDLDRHPFRLARAGTEQGAPTLYFNVTNSPVLSINQTYNLKVTVSADNCTAEQALVDITVQSLAPKFDLERYDTEITEGSMSADPIETVSASSLATLNRINYFLKSATNGGEDFFEVGRTSGEIFLTSTEVDAEQVENFILFVEALDRSWEPTRVSFAYVYVTVNDSNDNSPIFQDTPYEVEIPESGYDKPIFTVKASDADASDFLQYSMLTENTTFEINNDGGLFVVGELDVDNVTDSQLEYTLVVTVSDGMNDVSVNVTITVTDVNDNPPVFDKDDYLWVLPEGEPVTGKAFEVVVTDKDSYANITFSLDDGSDNRFQLLDSKTGEITADGTFDRETEEEILLVVMATDGKFTSETTVKVMITDINDNSPEFIMSSGTSLEVTENAEVGTLVFSFIVTDADQPGTNNSQIILSIQDEPDFGIKVADDGDGYQLFVNGTLDRETRELYEMTIVASNPGFPEVSKTLNVTVTLLDVNDNAPEFLTAEEDIALETSTTFDLIASLLVIDRDKEPNYFKFSSSGEDRNLFFVSPTDGGCLVFLKSKLELSSEPYILNIEVWNPDSPELKEDHSTIRLRVFYGSLPCFEIVPKDPELTLVVPGDVEFDILTMSVNISDCSDPSDKSDIMFNVTRATYKKDLETLNADDTDDVSIDQVTGNLSLASPSLGLYDILVEAYNVSDVDIPTLTIRMYSRVEVRLTEVANNPPTFMAPEFIIPARILPLDSGTELWDFSKNVTDMDSPAFGNGELLFFIDEVECDDCDASAGFNMTADGKLILAKDLTTLSIQTVNLTIRAQDRAVEPLNDTARVSLGFRPASTAPPMFVQECKTPILIQEENDEVNMLVCDVRAVSGDDLPVIYGFKGDEPGNFTINSATGEIFTTRAFDYDDSDRQFELLVFARTSDTSPEGFTVVYVQIVDINDHAPEFLQNAYKFELDEDLDSACQNDSMLPGEWLVKATDDDSTSINQNVEYFIVGESEDFKIDTTTGKISKLRCINAENYTSDVFTLTINATNPDAILQLMGSVRVSFVIRDLNDNSPIFDEASDVPVWVPYLMSDVSIKTVLAQDQDVSEYNSDVTYSFATDQDLNVYRYFTIKESSGEIRTTNVTGYDVEELFGNNNELKIIVNARDNGSPPREADQQGIVAILYDPNNLNEPYFPEQDREQEIFPPENDVNWCGEFRPPYSTSLDIIVLYSIIDVIPSNETSTFYLPETDKPKVCSLKSFDREEISEYIITIKAASCNKTEEDCSSSTTTAGLRDRARRFSLQAIEASSGDADFSEVVITLRVKDVNDATPEFDKDFIEGANKFIIAVQDNTPYGKIIFQVKATDGDAQSHLNYSIKYGDPSSAPNFVMDDLTGELTIQDRVESYLSDVTFDTNKEQAAYKVTLKVNDDLTNQSDKASSEVEAKIKLLFIYEYAILVIDKKPKDVNSESSALVECLSNELGLTLVVDSVEAHVILPSKFFFTYTPIEIDQERTDVWIHMIDMRNGAKFVKYWDFKELWDSNKGKSKCFSADVTLRPPQPHSLVAEQFDESMIASVALLAMASFIGVSTVLMMVAIIYMWHNVKLQGGRQISRKLDMLMLTENDKLSSQYSGVDNQAYEPDDLGGETAPIKETEVKVDVGEQAFLEPAGTSAELIEPAYANIPRVSVEALQSEPKSTLIKGPEHYESQEVVFDFPLEDESDTDTGVADFAHIRTRTYPNGEPGHEPASVEIVNEKPDKLNQADGEGVAIVASAEQQDKKDEDAQKMTEDSPQGDVKTETPSTEIPTGDVGEEPVQDLCPLQPEDTEVKKKLSASVTESDPKQEADEDFPPPPPPPPTPGELSADSEPATPKSDPKHDDMPLPPPPPQLLFNSDEKNKSMPSTPQSSRFIGKDSHSGSQSSSEGTPLTDFVNGEIPDFLDDLEVTKL